MWGFYSKNGTPLSPRVYSTGKKQDELIDEIHELFETHDLIFLKAIVGSGKSVIAISLCKLLGRGIIVVPVKELQKQYEDWYFDQHYIDLGTGKISIRQIKGRSNFWCTYCNKYASSAYLPCTRRIDRELGETRWSVASECPDWNPIYPEEKSEGLAMPYHSITGTLFYIKRGNRCEYFNQYEGYIKDDVLVMNSAKWIIETLMGRKPKVSLEVIDEADDFLDRLTFETTIGGHVVKKLKKDGIDIENKLDLLLAGELEPIQFLLELKDLLSQSDAEYPQELYQKIKLILNYKDSLEYTVDRAFVKYFIPDPSITLASLLEKSATKILLMSATAQSPEVLRDIYKIDPVFVEGEVKYPGMLFQCKVGKEEKVNYKKWESSRFRERYWNCLAEILEVATRPTLVNLHAFKYLPKERIGLIPSESEVKEYQDLNIDLFKLGQEDILFTTKCDRGIDLPDDKCRSIVMLKMPYPLRTDPILMAMMKRFGKEKFEIYYQDLTDRTFIQSIGRVLRSEDDYAEFWSPDLVAHEALHELWKGEVK